ncbi:MAG: hypothetical protein HZB23_05000 [Deltaproteobacteria bacterium]|nr:hypothetical protein [Deltaproteobacteria bacterium]
MAISSQADPFLKMKLALVKTILAEQNPSLDFLEQTFVEEFGSPPSADLVALFENELKKRLVDPGSRRIHLKLNLIREYAKAKADEYIKRECEALGGKCLPLALDKDILITLDRLQSVFSTNDHQEVIVLALKLLEQKAKKLSPESFRN